MKYWLWSVTEENWPNVKKYNSWGVGKKKNITKSNIGDYIIFYVKGTGSFQGIYEIISDWKNHGPDLSDVNQELLYDKFPVRCKIKKIIEGDAVFNELLPKLDCTKRTPNTPQFTLMNSSTGAANWGQPLSQHDYDLIYNSLKEVLVDNELVISDNSEHEDIIQQLESIADVLGFNSYTEQEYTKVAKGSVVDVVWETKIANIGTIRYVFEVQSKGSIKSLIDNLINSMNNPHVKKVIVVSDKEQLADTHQRIHSMRILNDSTRNMFVFLDIKTIESFYKLLPEINQFRNFFNELHDQFK